MLSSMYHLVAGILVLLGILLLVQQADLYENPRVTIHELCPHLTFNDSAIPLHELMTAEQRRVLQILLNGVHVCPQARPLEPHQIIQEDFCLIPVEQWNVCYDRQMYPEG